MPTRKLIEVALPLEAINTASAREKSIRHGHPSTLHLWWARRPLAACRAVLFASLVDDPSSHPDRFQTEEAQQRERERLFGIIERLVKWENSTNEHVLREAREEILKHTNGNPPPVYDPFAGGGSIPLEAQRLGLEAHASDLNPVAVLINKALIEIPPRFANMPPVNPEDRNRIGADWKGAAGLAADVRYYGKWMRDEAEKRIAHLYPKVRLPKEYGGGEATVIAWLWARTVKCPNPACGAQMPLVRSFALSTKKGKEHWVEPVVERGMPPQIRFTVQSGRGNVPEGTVGRKGARCVCCDTPVPLEYIRNEGKAGRMATQMMAIVAEGKRGRVYIAPSDEQIHIAEQAAPSWMPDMEMPYNPFSVRPPLYGLKLFSQIFTHRQLLALDTFSALAREAENAIEEDMRTSNLNQPSLSQIKGEEIKLYSAAILVYLAFAIDKGANYWSTLCSWHSGRDTITSTFGRQAMPMIWDFAEANPLSGSSGNFLQGVEQSSSVVEKLPASSDGIAIQMDASNITQMGLSLPLISTDPPYYNNIDYADLSDFFYVWLRRSVGHIYPDIFSTLLSPKAQELIATPYRFNGSKQQAEDFFEAGLREAFSKLSKILNTGYPLSIFYAFKQSENDEDDDGTPSDEVNSAVKRASTGWETMLEGLVDGGFTITGTWPMRTELVGNLKRHMSVLASSIVLVCRPRPEDARAATRREFINTLKAEMPGALRRLQQGNIAPVDLAQAAIGPGMAVFSRYSKVVESDGSPMRVRTALQIINQELDAVLAEQEGEFDGDTRWAIAWFDQYGVNEGPYGVAETLSKAKNTSVEGMVEAGIVVARSGKVRLLSRDELPADWDPGRDRRVTVWEVAQHLVHALDKRGEGGAAALLAQLGGEGEIARDLAYRLYTTCERKGWAQEALAYNSLVVAWPEIRRLAAEAQRGGAVQGRMEI
jgi:putative DNA methylase